MNAQPSKDLRARVLLAIERTPSPTRAQVSSRMPIVVVMTALLMTAIFMWVGGFAHAAPRPVLFTVIAFVGTLGIAAIATWAAVLPGKSMLGRSREFLWAIAVGTPLAIGAWTMLEHFGYADHRAGVLGWRCFVLMLANAPWPFAAMVVLKKRIDPLRPGLLGAALGSAAGAWSGVVVDLWCPLAEPGHVVRGHLVPFAVLIAVGALLGRRIFTVRHVISE